MGVVYAQRGFGLRFSSDLNYFYKASEYHLVDGTFSNIVLGVFAKSYNKYGGLERGFNFCYKPKSGLPLVAKDFADNQQTSLLSWEAEFRCGPRILKYFYPKLGFILGYRVNNAGFLKANAPPEYKISKWYTAIPLGFSIDLPLRFGNTGIGFFYDVGLSKVIPIPSLSIDYSPRMRAFNFEITVMVGDNGKNEEK